MIFEDSTTHSYFQKQTLSHTIKPENQQQNSSDKRQEEQKNNQQPSDRKQQPSAEKRAQQKKQQARDFLNMNRDEEAEDEARYSKRVFDLKNQRMKPNKDY
jgi:hypothetical protein